MSATRRPAPRRNYRYDRSFILGVINGVLFNLAEATIGGTTVLPIFISQITASKVLIGLAGTMVGAGLFMPQIIVANLVEHIKRKKPIYVWSGAVRVGAMWAIALLVALAGHSSSSFLLAGFFILFTAYCLAGGVANIPFMDIVAKTVPTERRGTFFGARMFFGGIAAALAGLLVKDVLASRPFPAGFALLFIAAAAVVTAAVVSFSIVSEPVGPSRETRTPFGQFLRKGPLLLRNVKSYRMLFVVRILLGVWGMPLPFYILYAQEKLSLAPGSVGILLSIQMIGAFLSNLLWGHLSNHRGNRIVLILVSAVAIACPLVTILGVLCLPGPPIVAFGLAFFLIGVAWSGLSLGYTNYILDVSPVAERPTYLGFMNTFLSPVLLLAAVGGFIIERSSYEVLFVTAIVAAAGALVASLELEEPRHKHSHPVEV
jgi:MFS family permease